MLIQQLTLSYECLASIGNSLEIESMISEVIITFSRKTGAVAGSYFENIRDEKALIHIGKKIKFNILLYEMSNRDHTVIFEDDKQIVILPLKHGYLLFIYKNKEKTIDKLASILGNFQHKINLSVSACEGVSDLEQLNEKLEDRVHKAVEKIRESEKMLISQSKQAVMGEMIGMIAHQWRQPITSIGMISNNIIFDIALGDLKEENLKGDLDKINEQVMFLSKTIDDFRDFFKESKTKDRIVIGSVIDGVMTLLAKQLEKLNINLVVSNEIQELHFLTYKNELIQVFLNIISNAKDAFDGTEHENKSIFISCKADETNIEIKIRDNAGGIKPTVIGKIFEPYFSTKKQKNGTGLGLYMSMIIITEHIKGEMLVENVDDGAEFKILIPLVGE